MLRRLGIRGKVLAALAGPVLALVLIASLLSWQSASAARASGDGRVVAKLLVPHASVVNALQAERTQARALAAGRPGADVRTARASTDEAISEMATATNVLPTDIFGGRIADLLEQAVTMQASVDQVRGGIVDAPERAVDMAYTQLITGVVSMPVMLSQRLSEPDLAGEFRAYGLALTASEELAHEAPVVRAVLLEPNEELDSVHRLPVMIALTDRSIAEAQSALDPLGVESLRLADAPAALVALREALSSGDPATIAGADGTQLSKADAMQHQLSLIRADLMKLIDHDAQTLAGAANRQALLTAGGALLAVLLSLLVALTIARGIVRPMRGLTKAALTVRDELPRLIDQVAIPGQTPNLSLVEIPVTSNDEVGRLAAAFNEVNATTISVAQEQAALRGSIAEMFVNVARRDQVLLNRQLSFIDALERSEEDPKVLADLFRLDHLATRMRRNAESLLVLAGIDTGRRLRDTLLLSDVIRTASSEIEHYERVLLELPADPIMLGHTALPAAHLLAELLENATMFSEPGSPVHVSTGRDETHVLITVLDQGLGMTPEELDAAQAKIQSASAGEVLGSQRLGMFVIGRIASRLGAKVELGVGPYGNGMQATIRLPLALFVDIADTPLVAPIVPAAAIGRHFPVPEPTDLPEIAARPVDLADLTDGATGLGLPRRRIRSADVSAEAPSLTTGSLPVVDGPPAWGSEELLPTSGDSTIPDAPQAGALAGAAATVGEDWVPPISMAAPLVRRRRGQHAAPTDERGEAPESTGPTPHPWADGSSRRARNRRVAEEKKSALDADPATGSAATDPSGEQGGAGSTDGAGVFQPQVPVDAPEGTDWFGGTDPAPGGLPTRTRSAPAPVPMPSLTPSSAAQVAPETRASMFGGFRSRRAEVAAAQLEVRAPEQLSAPAVEQIVVEPTLDEPASAAFVVPLLVEDEEWEPAYELPLGVPVDYDDAAHASPAMIANPWEVGYEAPVATSETDDDDEDWAPMPLAPVVAEVDAPFFAVDLATELGAPEVAVPAVIEPAAGLSPFALPQSPEPVALPASWANGTAVLPLGGSAPEADFSSLLTGEVPTVPTVPTAAKPRRRGLFARRQPKAAARTTPPPFAAPVPVLPEVILPQQDILPALPLVDRAPSVTPARQSAWSANGSHVQQGWDPTEDATSTERGLPAVAELASLSFRPQEPVAPVVEEVPPAPVAPFGAIAPSPAQSAAVSTERSWTPDLHGVEMHSYPSWPSPQRTAAAATADEDEVHAGAIDATTHEAQAPTSPGAHDSSLPARPGAGAPRAGVPAQPGYATFVPSGSRENDPIALRAGIAQQALSELSMLSSYRPQTVGGAKGSTAAAPLVRRTPVVIPKDEPVTPRQPAAPRDANEVRSLLASFQSGTSRGRSAVDEVEPEITVDAAKQGTSW